MSSTNFLIDKYSQRVPYENRGREHDKIRKREERKKEVLNYICEEVFFECESYKKLKLTRYQKIRVKFLVKKFQGNFDLLHGNASKRAVVLAFIFYIKKNQGRNLCLDDYKITGEYGLSHDVFELIICRLCEHYMRNAPVPPHGSTSFDHEILSKHGGTI